MAQSPLRIDQASFNRQIADFTKKYGKAQNEVDARTINELAKKSVSRSAKEIQEKRGYKQSTIKREIKVKPRARANALFTQITARGRRLPWPSPREVRAKGKAVGVSFLGENKKRVKITTPINGGSKPFIFRGRNSGAKLIGYRQAGYNKTITAYTGHSVPYMLEKDWDERTRRWIIKEYPKERDKQQKKQQYLKERKLKR